MLDADPEALPSALKVMPSNVLEAEQALRAFDCSTRWNQPCPSPASTALRDALRRRRFPGTPTGREWVDDILRRFPALGKLRATERYCAGADTVSVMATSSAQDLPAASGAQLPDSGIPRGMPALGDGTLVTQKILAPENCLWQQQTLPPGSAESCVYSRTLPNVGNTCFFNSLLQAVASISPFVAEIAGEPLEPDYADDSYCLAFLKLFIPAIAKLSSEPKTVLNISSVRSDELRMNTGDWADFALRLTRRYDPRYNLGAFADPGELLDYILSIVPKVGQLCTIDFGWSSMFSCACGTRSRECTVCEKGIMVPVSDSRPLIHHILGAFSLESVSDFRCERCGSQSGATRPAFRQRSLLTLPSFLRINITAPLTPEGLQQDFYQHGPLSEFDQLDLSLLAPSPQSEQAHYVLRAASETTGSICMAYPRSISAMSKAEWRLQRTCRWWPCVRESCFTSVSFRSKEYERRSQSHCRNSRKGSPGSGKLSADGTAGANARGIHGESTSGEARAVGGGSNRANS